MIGYIYLIKLTVNGINMFKIGMTTQLQYNRIIRLQTYPKQSKICFVATVPLNCVKIIETEIIACLSKKFTLVHGKEYFQGDEKEILKCVSSKINSVYYDENMLLDNCDVFENDVKTRVCTPPP